MSSVVTKSVKTKPGPVLEAARASFTRATLDQCMRCTICEIQRPVLWVTEKFLGLKYVGPQAECYRGGYSVDYSLDYCPRCSICFISCPQGVKIAEINVRARVVMEAGHISLRGWLVTQTELEGKLLTPFAPIVNWTLDVEWLRKLVEVVIGAHTEVPIPKV